MRIRLVALCATLLFVASAVPASATPYSELHQPTNGQLKGIVIVIHGGAWAGGQQFVQDPYVQAAANRFNSWGWRTLNVDYATASSPGHEFDGYNDIHNWVAIARYNIGPSKPVCLWGGSAGGHYALLEAQANTAHVDCTLVEAAPTNLNTMPASVQPIIASSFGSWTNFLSPINWTGNYTRPLAMATATTDDAVPISTQGQPFVNAINAAGKIALWPLWLQGDPNGCQFAHVKARCSDVNAWLQMENNVLNAAHHP